MENLNIENTKEEHGEQIALDRKPFSSAQMVSGIGIALALLIAIAIGIHSRRVSSTVLAETTDRAAVPTVNVATVVTTQGTADLVLPGTTESFTETAVYARTNGYLKKWYFDIGARVRQDSCLRRSIRPNSTNN